MHPLFKSGKKIAFTGLLWSPVTFWVIMLHKLITGEKLIDSAVFVTLPMALEFIIAMSLWYICKSTQFSHDNILNFYLKHFVSLTALTLLLVSFSYGYSQILSNIYSTEKWEILFSKSILLLTGVAASIYILTSLFFYLSIANGKIIDAEKRVLKQKLETTTAELKALKTTVHPHFLFNSLNILKPLIKKDPKKTTEVISRLSEFLIYSYMYANRKTTSIEKEIEHIKNYLEIEKIRLGDRLRIKYSIGRGVLNHQVIPLILLPLTENGIKHGISQLINGGTLEIKIKKKNSFLVFEFKNPYDESIRNNSETGGHGLSNLKKRVKLYYGDKAGIITEKNKNIFGIRLFIPLTDEEGKNG